MNTQVLETRRSELRASMTSEMSMIAVRAAQERINLLSSAIAAQDRMAEAIKAADEAMQEAIKWAI